MGISRRRFLRYAAGLPAAVTLARQTRSVNAAMLTGSKQCLVLDCECVLRESLEGYVAGLRAAGAPFEIASPRVAKPAPVVIVPAASLNSVSAIRWLRNQIEAGALVLVESGGAFLSSSQFRRQQSLVSSQFKLTMLQPIRLWENHDGFCGLPYVDLTWPVPARVRDFSRIIALNENGTTVIGRVNDRVIACKRRLGAGALVFLGSPLGPHILAGDREGQRWLEAFWGQNLAGC